ncbi:SIMPL domain-containing protein [Leucobacter sp. M11]|uniref:SIMPL domain-containing protein n=1 Tax=Leucobacter sp. M11 TaxID=2993565 RepID=UPI002D7E4716|nr:SIMPL domain-containing protein [Leucobacter sp. M11]MEB4613898.1 SIMPL domain-containing protein [Leucobacter sp. M11]
MTNARAATTITVTGQATEKIAPDLGAVRLSVGFSSPDRAEVVDSANRAHAAVIDSVRALPEAEVDSWTSGQLRFWSYRPWNDQGEVKPLQHEAKAEITVRFSDFSALSAWVAEITLVEGTTLDGIEWSLREDTEQRVLEAAQREAVAAAVRKAEVYAAALALGTVTPVEVSDPGLLSPEQPPFARSAMMSDSLRMSAPGGSGAQFQPEDLTVEARVNVRFTAGGPAAA